MPPTFREVGATAFSTEFAAIVDCSNILIAIASCVSVIEFAKGNARQIDNLGGTENTATAREKHSEEKGEDGASVSNAVVMQSMQQMQHQMQQQGQQIESKIGGTTEKIDIVQENQLILQTHIDETHQQFEGKVNVLKEKVDNAIGQLDARINAQEKDADAVKNEIKALKKELAKQQTNDVTTSSIKVKTPLFDGTTNFNAFKLQFGVVATKNMWDEQQQKLSR
uniref:t-SNARE coiled-coil homology domain-containing protein n=1 Tax=Glossina austeni TaxID=7395 RepID=A0A1A9VAJ1_GLOAU